MFSPQGLISHSGKLLKIFGIKQNLYKACLTKRNSLSFIVPFLHPFPLFLHVASLYNLTALLIEPFSPNIAGSKSKIASIVNSALSLITWHVAFSRSKHLQDVIKNCKRSPAFNRKRTKSKYIFQEIMMFAAISVGFFFPVLFALNTALFTKFDADYVKFWFLGYSVEEIDSFTKLLLFSCSLIYMEQQFLFPTAMLLFFCLSAMRLARNLEQFKYALKACRVCKISTSNQHRIHHKLLMQVQKHETSLSLTVFVLLCLIMVTGFAGLALVLEYLVSSRDYNIFEAIFYLYFCSVPTVSVIFSASQIPHQLTEIRKLYRSAYESCIDDLKNSFSFRDGKSLSILKMALDREVIHLFAWNVIRLDKALAFKILGGLVTYGFLILQFEKDT